MNDRPRVHRRAAAAVLLCVFAWLAAAGCSGPAPIPVPAAKESAMAWNRRGLAAEKRGDRDGALSAFREALKIHRSIEDDSGAAVSLVNLARVHRLGKELVPARERIDEALPLVSPGDALFPEVAFEKGKIALAAGDLPAAEAWSGKAVAAGKGAPSGRMLNLLGRVLLLEGKGGEARPRAAAALEANRMAKDSAEEANSLRLLGDLAAAGGDRPEAEKLYLQALAVDKEIAESAKIAADLRALGAAAAARGDAERAIAFYGRAAEVSRNGDDPEGAAAALSEISRLRREGAPRER
ncbi:MAG: tetratricopeptide repeat protein [Thermodesulfobacteriota bacterium]